MRELKDEIALWNCDLNNFLSTFRKFRVVRPMRLVLARP